MKKIEVTKEIYLKTPTIDDAPKSYALLNNDRAELMDIFNFVTKDSTLEDEKNFVSSLDSDKYLFNIFYNDDICGKIGIFSYDKSANSYEIYYYLGSEYRSMGIAIQAINVFTSYVFNELKARKIKFYINTDNDASNKTAQRLSLKFIETVKNRDFCNGKYHDQHLYAMYSPL